MRHRKAGRKFGRNTAHRKALLRNLAKALLVYGRIVTTETKAKTLRTVVEPLITLALRNDLHARRQAFRVLNDQKLVNRLFEEIGPCFAGGGGGYTRVVKMSMPRKGDSAPMAIIELTKVQDGAKDAPVTEEVAKAAPKKAPTPKKSVEKKEAVAKKPAAKKEAAPKKATPKAPAEKK